VICPHCRIAYREEVRHYHIEDDADGTHYMVASLCPSCNRLMITHGAGEPIYRNDAGMIPDGLGRKKWSHLIHPLNSSTHGPAPAEVSPDLARDYEEAAMLAALSPMASAALSRRCLQNTIRDKTGISKGNLAQEIDDVIGQNLLPADLADQLDAIRHIGNFAAHPIKSQDTGSIMAVEPEEAEWNLGVLEGLFEFWYVRPARTAAHKADLNRRLRDAGKPELS
jgi:Domain of unknown function (DUF4145)